MLFDFPFSSFNVAYAEGRGCPRGCPCTKPAASARMVVDGETAPEGRFQLARGPQAGGCCNAIVSAGDRVRDGRTDFDSAPQSARPDRDAEQAHQFVSAARVLHSGRAAWLFRSRHFLPGATAQPRFIGFY